jgi:hypothetical protein
MNLFLGLTLVGSSYLMYDYNKQAIDAKAIDAKKGTLESKVIPDNKKPQENDQEEEDIKSYFQDYNPDVEIPQPDHLAHLMETSHNTMKNVKVGNKPTSSATNAIHKLVAGETKPLRTGDVSALKLDTNKQERAAKLSKQVSFNIKSQQNQNKTNASNFSVYVPEKEPKNAIHEFPKWKQLGVWNTNRDSNKVNQAKLKSKQPLLVKAPLRTTNSSLHRNRSFDPWVEKTTMKHNERSLVRDVKGMHNMHKQPPHTHFNNPTILYTEYNETGGPVIPPNENAAKAKLKDNRATVPNFYFKGVGENAEFGKFYDERLPGTKIRHHTNTDMAGPDLSNMENKKLNYLTTVINPVSAKIGYNGNTAPVSGLRQGDMSLVEQTGGVVTRAPSPHAPSFLKGVTGDMSYPAVPNPVKNAYIFNGKLM